LFADHESKALQWLNNESSLQRVLLLSEPFALTSDPLP
jgi:hypothetical protein